MERRTGFYVALAALAVVLLRQRANRRKVVHPPSPMSLPFLGNLLAMPPGLEHLAFMKLGKELKSDMIYLKLLGQNIVVLNSAQAASDLLDKRSLIYSERACPPMVKDPELFDWGGTLGLLPCNDIWRHHRRLINHWLNPRAVRQFEKIQENQSRLLLQRLLGVSAKLQPFEEVKAEILFTTASSMFHLVYGYTLKDSRDPLFVKAQAAIKHVLEAAMFTNFYVNLFPALVRVPDWLPATGWKQTIREWRKQKDEALDAPYQWTRSQVETGCAEHSILGAVLQDPGLSSDLREDERELRLKELGIDMISGGTDTSVTILVNYIAAMVLNPHVQVKAQREIDTVLGSTTLPVLSDRERLPFVNNLILELLRWRPSTPIAVPHVCRQDDTYQGYDILKDTVVIGNVWAMSRDENVYKDPERFNPDRFLDPGVPAAPVFGWGRRKCGGIHFAEGSLFMFIASLLAAYTFSKRKDQNGNEIEPVIKDGDSALNLELKSFEFEFRPRSREHHQLIMNAV